MSEPEICPFFQLPIRLRAESNTIPSEKIQESCFAERGPPEDCPNPLNYKKCERYAQKYLAVRLSFPRICPLLHICHKEKGVEHSEPIEFREESCPCGYIDPKGLSEVYSDYLDCIIFSKWFWSLKIEDER